MSCLDISLQTQQARGARSSSSLPFVHIVLLILLIILILNFFLIFQALDNLPPSRAWASAQDVAGVWDKVRHGFLSLQAKNDGALHGTVLELLALMHQLEEGTVRSLIGFTR